MARQYRDGNPPGGWEEWVIPQQWEAYDRDQHEVWDTLFARQTRLLQGRILSRFFDGIAATGLDEPGIPDFRRLNARLEPLTGWTVVPVPGLVPDDIFYQMLSESRFPVGNFIRNEEQLDYLQEPDLFHDIFGHVPMLADEAFADMERHFGRIGLAAVRAGRTELIARLYWHTVEFGLTRENGALRILGGGLASSKGESIYCLDSDEPQRVPFELGRVVNTPYKIDRFQPLYFITDNIRAVVGEIEGLEFADVARIADEWAAANG